MPTETTNDLADVELIERGDFELSEEVTNEPLERGPIIGSKSIAVAAVAIILLALAIISRPGPRVTVEENPGQTTVPTTPTTSIPDEATGAVSRLTTTVVTQPIPLFDDVVTPEVPGIISGVDAEGSLILIDRRRVRPQEKRLGMSPSVTDPKSTLIVTGAGPVSVDRELTFEGTQVFVNHDDGRFLEPSFGLDEIAPDVTGSALIVSHLVDSQEAVVIPLTWDGIDRDALLRWELPGHGVEVLGVWGNGLVVHQANRVWLLDSSGEARLLGDGLLLAFDGVHLARVVCDGPAECTIAVGQPDEPNARTLPVPPTLAALDTEDWVDSVSISPDGRRLGASVRFGGLSLPVVVDLETGEAQTLADGINLRAPLAWSPDGEWLAYVYTDDVMVWNLDEGRSWRVQVNRDIETLLWR